MSTTTRSLSRPDGGHRARLVDGLAEAIREHGSIHAITVADVVRHARTSRRTFYEHFADREACFLALVDELSDRTMTALAGAAAQAGPWEERLDRSLGAYLGAIAEDPVVARTCILELPSIGPTGTDRSREMTERWAHAIAAMIEQARESDPSLRPISIEVAIVITGGFRDLILATLGRGGDVLELRAIGGEMIRRLVA